MPDPPETLDRARLVETFQRLFAQQVPHNLALGVEIVDVDEGVAVMRLPYRADLVGDPRTGVLHGGAITSLMDATCGAAVFMRLLEARRIATLDLRIDYLKPATPGQAVTARATCYKMTRSVAFVRGVAYCADAHDPIASVSSTFAVFRSQKGWISRGSAEGDP